MQAGMTWSFLIKKEDYRGKEYEALSGAAVLLFGKNPQRFFQRAQVRVIRYEGTEAKVGTEMNVIKDEIFTGPILKLTNDVLLISLRFGRLWIGR